MKYLTPSQLFELTPERAKAYRRSVLATLGRAERNALNALDLEHNFPAGSVFKVIQEEHEKLEPIITQLERIKSDQKRRLLKKTKIKIEDIQRGYTR